MSLPTWAAIGIRALSNCERAMRVEDTRAAVVKRKAERRRVGALPYGWSDDGMGRLVPNDAERATVATVRSLRAAGLSFRGIVAELGKRGLVGRTGRPFALRQVQLMLEVRDGES